MHRFTYDALDEAATAALGAALADLLPNGAVVALCGTLGAGKTRLVQAIAQGCGVDPRDVVSPTFVLVHEYPGPGRFTISMPTASATKTSSWSWGLRSTSRATD